MNALSSCDASDPWVRDHMSIVWVIADRCGRRVVCGWLSLILFAGMYIAHPGPCTQSLVDCLTTYLSNLVNLIRGFADAFFICVSLVVYRFVLV